MDEYEDFTAENIQAVHHGICGKCRGICVKAAEELDPALKVGTDAGRSISGVCKDLGVHKTTEWGWTIDPIWIVQYDGTVLGSLRRTIDDYRKGWCEVEEALGSDGCIRGEYQIDYQKTPYSKKS